MLWREIKQRRMIDSAVLNVSVSHEENDILAKTSGR